ncbi:hypothetical protein FRC17_000461 [Serendipita sp. 399]|nr:hypothetical protein FRC17_000461 [Serendipita sp. 399]
MPVATQAALKGLTPQQVEQLGISLILNNTYHLNLRPGTDVLAQAGGAHAFQGWRKNLLTDSGGFQLVSLSSFTEITEEGALFASPFTGEPTMLTIARRIDQNTGISSNVFWMSKVGSLLQHSIGADIIMQLDDVGEWLRSFLLRGSADPICPVSSLTTGPRVEEAMQRSVRWLDRCVAYHKASGRDKIQNLFAIIQGGLDAQLRKQCLTEMVKRKDDIPGYAIGGLSGGEEKGPRYSMGIGFAEDLLVCIALGADCVFPTRTARFGVALTFNGPLNLRLSKHSTDFRPIDDGCPCPTCSSGTSRALLHNLITHETVAAHVFQARLVGQARDAIMQDKYPQYLKEFFREYFGTSGYPRWCIDALKSVGVDLLEDVPPSQSQEIKIVEGDGAKWEYSES